MKICIDPGHGMSNRQKGIYDPGATHTENNFQFEEAAIALRYSLALKDVLREREIEVFMTRDDPTDHTPVGKRAPMAVAAGSDALISIHLNDFDDDNANGLEVLYRSEASKSLATKLHDTLTDLTHIRKRGIKRRDDLAVLKFEGVAVLVELGFIANDADRQKLISADIRDAMTRRIADVLVAHLSLPSSPA